MAASPGAGTPAPVPTAYPSCKYSQSSDALASWRPPSPMPTPGDMPAGSTMRAIEDRPGGGYLIVGVNQDEYHDASRVLAASAPPGEEYQGFDVDILHAVAAFIFSKGKAGKPDKAGADHIKYVPVTEDFRLGASDEGIVDVVADSVTTTCDRWQQVNYSADYVFAGAQLLVSRTYADKTKPNFVTVKLDGNRVPQVRGLAGGKVCTIGTTTSIGELGPLEKSGGFSVVLAENWSDCLVLLQQGVVRAMSTDNTILRGLAAQDPNLTVTGDEFSYEPHGLVFPKSDPAAANDSQFIGFVNGVIAYLESPASLAGYCPETVIAGDTSCWMALYRTWLGTPPRNPPALVYLP